MNDSARYDIAHLGYVELFTPEIRGQQVVLHSATRDAGGRRRRRQRIPALLGDYEHHTVKLTTHHTSGIGSLGYRT
jgi:catechol 2,3-dioxygenase